MATPNNEQNLLEKVNALKDAVEAAEARIAELNKENASSAQAFFAQMIKLDATIERLAASEERLAASEERLAASEERLAASDARLAALEATNVAIMAASAKTNSKLDSLLSNAGAAEDVSQFAEAAAEASPDEAYLDNETLVEWISAILGKLSHDNSNNVTELGKEFATTHGITLNKVAINQRGYPPKNDPRNNDGITPVKALLKELFPEAYFDLSRKDLGNGKFHYETYIRIS